MRLHLWFPSEVNRNDSKFQVAEAGKLVSSLATSMQEQSTVKKADYQDNEIVYAALWLIGDATENGWI